MTSEIMNNLMQLSNCTLGRKIRVLIIDDSKLIRDLLTQILASDDEIEVVGSAEDPYDAREKIKQLRPDVLTLDIEMPRMDGITFLRNLMRLRPMPVVMISTLTEKDAETTFKALELGAVDFVAKPKVNVKTELAKYSQEVCDKVRAASKARVRGASLVSKPKAATQVANVKRNNQRQIVAIGSSTGGTEAIKEFISGLPKDSPPIVITQHIPPVFSTSFAMRMDRTCKINVKEAEHGDKLQPGWAYIAPGDQHLSVVKKAGGLFCQLDSSDLVNRHRPAVDVLFHSLVVACPKETVAAILTGMGSDGAKGMLALNQAGAYTIAQDELSSVVWGMPKAAVELNAANEVVRLDKVAAQMLKQAAKVQ